MTYPPAEITEVASTGPAYVRLKVEVEGHPLFVKAPRHNLTGSHGGSLREWIVGRLAQLMGLPTLPGRIVRIEPGILPDDCKGGEPSGHYVAYPLLRSARTGRYSELDTQARVRLFLLDNLMSNWDRAMGGQRGSDVIWDGERGPWLVDWEGGNHAFSTELPADVFSTTALSVASLDLLEPGDGRLVAHQAGKICNMDLSSLDSRWVEATDAWPRAVEGKSLERFRERLARLPNCTAEVEQSGSAMWLWDSYK